MQVLSLFRFLGIGLAEGKGVWKVFLKYPPKMKV